MYEWDEEKNNLNLLKHGLSCEDVESVFDGSTLTFEDTRFNYKEPRFITLGLLDERLLVIVDTPRGDRTRIITMRKANKREQKTYQERLKAH